MFRFLSTGLKGANNRLLGDTAVVWVTIGFASVVSLFLFGGCLTGDHELAFRDVRHFYTPLFDYIQHRSHDAWFPLWSPLDQFGVPLAGEPTTAIFYPPRMLLSTVNNTSICIAWYVLLHLWWAGIGAHRLSRFAGATGTTAILAAFAYPMSGCVFFLYTNPPFLVGAAWLPWIVLTFVQLSGAYYNKTTSGSLTRPTEDSVSKSVSGRAFGSRCPATYRKISLSAICLAMCVLGGDPQTAMHAMLLIAVYHVVHQVKRFDVQSLSRVTSAIVLAILLAMPQIAASVAWASHSHRYADAPSVFDLSTQPAEPDSHANHVYDFSVAPWHFTELVTPNAFGTRLPVNARLSKLIPGEPRMWTETLYCGLVVFLLIMVSFRRSTWTPWLAIGIGGLALSLGEFGLGMLLRTTALRLGLEMPFAVEDAAGGPYWFLVSLLPGYGQFRYPAKWLVFVALGFSVHAAVILEPETKAELAKKLNQAFAAVGLIAIMVLACSYIPVVQNWLASEVAGATTERFWGPINLNTAFQSIRISILQTLLVSGCVLLLFYLCRQRGLGITQGVILIAVIDLVIAAQGHLHTIPTTSTAVQPVGELANDFPQRFIATGGYWNWPARWRETSDFDRLPEVEAAQRETWFRRWYLTDRVAMLNGTVSMPAAATVQFWSEAGRFTQQLAPDERRKFQQSLAGYLAVDGWVGRDVAAKPVTRRIVDISDSQPWIRCHQQWRVSSRNNPNSVRQWMAGFQSSPIHRPVVKTRQPKQAPMPNTPASLNTMRPKIRGLKWSPESIEFEINVSSTNLIQIMQFQDGGWKATGYRTTTPEKNEDSEPIPLEIYPVDHISQGLFLSSGQWKVRLLYAPIWWWPSWLAVILGTLLILTLELRRYFVQLAT